MGIITKAGAINFFIQNSLARRVRGKEKIIIPLLMAIMAVGGFTFGMTVEGVAFVPAVITLCVALGYDALVGMAIVFIGGNAGYTAGIFNPFNVGVAQSIAELDADVYKRQEKTEEAAKTVDPKSVKLAYVSMNLANPWNATVKKGFEAACEELGCEYISIDSEYKVDKQVASLESLVNDKYSGFVFTPIDPNATWDIVEQAKAPVSYTHLDVYKRQDMPPAITQTR